MANHLFLVGYRGSGKSSVALRLGELLRLSAIDSDDMIEQEAGKSIRAIFADDGEPRFRDFEEQVIRRLADRPDPAVISLGGGAILREQNRRVLKNHGTVVWLRASVAEIAKRVANDSATAERRPALTQLAERDEIAKLLEVREPLYREVADLIVGTDHRPIGEIADEIADWFTASPWSQASERTE
jgi:shikimate kinase